MLSLTENIVIVVLVMTLALLVMAAVNRFWPANIRYAKEDLIGWQLNMLATTHAVILGFMLYTEWTNFTASQVTTELEASALRNVYRLAAGLPSPARSQLQAQARAYATAVITDDWPQMAHGHTAELSHGINESMWKTLLGLREGTPAELTALDHALTELARMTEFRRTRLLQAVGHLPVIFWWVLMVGGVLTITSVAMFGSRNPRLHLFQVFSLTLLITLAMLAIADLDQPFRGWVHVDVYPFERALSFMN
jgi:hypothetical protein